MYSTDFTEYEGSDNVEELQIVMGWETEQEPIRRGTYLKNILISFSIHIRHMQKLRV